MVDKNIQITIEAEDQASSVLQRIGQNISSVSSAVEASTKTVSQYGSSVSKSLSNVRDSFGNVINKVRELPLAISAATSITTAAIAKMGITSAASIESSRAAFETLTGSAEEAEKIILRVQDAAKKTPFDQQALIDMNQTLIGSGLSAEVAFNTVMQLGDALAATGKGSAELTRIGNTISQVFGKGKADAVDFKEFVNAGWVTVRKDVAETMGLTMAQFEEAVSAGKVGFKEIQKALEKTTAEGGRFFGAMAKQSQTFNGAMSNLFDTLNVELGKLFVETGMFDGLKTALTGLTQFIGNAMPVIIQAFRDLFAILQPIGTAIMAVLAPLASFIGQHETLQRVIAAVIVGLIFFTSVIAVLGQIITVVSAIFGVMWSVITLVGSVLMFIATVAIPILTVALAFILSPMGLVILAIGAIIAVGYLLITHWGNLGNYATQIWEKIKATVTKALELIWWAFTTYLNLIWNLTVKIFQLMFGSIFEKMTAIDNLITTILKAVDKSFGTNLSAAYEKVKSFGGSIISVFNQIKDAIQGVINKLAELASKVPSGAGGFRGALGFQHGGVIPGSFNQEVPAILHGGERIVSRNGVDVNSGSGSGGGTVNIIIEGDVNSTDTLDRIVEAVKVAIGRDNELAQQGVSI